MLNNSHCNKRNQSITIYRGKAIMEMFSIWWTNLSFRYNNKTRLALEAPINWCSSWRRRPRSRRSKRTSTLCLLRQILRRIKVINKNRPRKKLLCHHLINRNLKRLIHLKLILIINSQRKSSQRFRDKQIKKPTRKQDWIRLVKLQLKDLQKL